MRRFTSVQAYRWLAILLVVIGSARIISTYRVFNFTIDEPAHAACGTEWLSAGTYRYEDQHPPLARVVAAVGLKISGAKWGAGPSMWVEGIGLLGGGAGRNRGLVYGRASMLVFFWIGCAAVFLWGSRISGPRAGFYNLLLFSTLPPILAHSGLITTDMAACAFTGSAFVASLYWTERPGFLRGVIFGVLLGCALLSKFSSLAFLPAAWLATYLLHLIRVRPNARHEFRLIAARCKPALFVMCSCAVVVWSGYRFSFGDADIFLYRVPAPEFFSGIDSVWQHNKSGHLSYLLGSRSLSGFWYYYPVAFAAKTPLAMIAVLCASVFFLKGGLGAAEPMAYSAGILAVAMFTHINIGIRHVLPVYMGLCVVCGLMISRVMHRKSPWWVIAAASLLLVGHVASGALQHPDYVAYTNEFWWNRPEQVLADSDVDWGQDMKRLADRLAALRVNEIRFDPFNRGYLLAFPFPHVVPVPEDDRQPRGWTAVSKTMWKVHGGPKWIDTAQPAERIGRSILLFHKR